MFVEIVVKEDPFFKRDQSDVHVEVPISFVQACLGDKIAMPTLKGEVDLKVPSGTQPGDRLVMRNRGVPVLNGGGRRGHQYVHFDVKVPKKLTDRQKELLMEFAEEAGDDLVRVGGGRVEHLAEVVGRDAAHVVVHRRQHRDRVLGHVDP